MRIVEVKDLSHEGRERNYRLKEIEHDIVDLYYGPVHIAQSTTGVAGKIGEALVTLEKKTGPWEEFDKLTEIHRQLKHTQDNLKDELDVIIFRRVVPGRCRYCPI